MATTYTPYKVEKLCDAAEKAIKTRLDPTADKLLSQMREMMLLQFLLEEGKLTPKGLQNLKDLASEMAAEIVKFKVK